MGCENVGVQEKFLRVLGYLRVGVGIVTQQEKFLRVLGCLVYTYKKVVGVPYIYSSIAYDSRRGCRNASVQWGAYPSAHERTEQVRE
jgi:hypothetical protein